MRTFLPLLAYWYVYTHTSNPMPTVASLSANSYLHSGMPEQSWTRVWWSGMPEAAQRQTPKHIIFQNFHCW